jgi:hypothetical protein
LPSGSRVRCGQAPSSNFSVGMKKGQAIVLKGLYQGTTFSRAAAALQDNGFSR